MNKHCLECNEVIPKKSKQWINQIYCTRTCRKNDHRKKKSATTRIEQKRANLRQNDEMLYLVRQCRRAKTIQILKGHDLDSFIETMELVKNRPKGDVKLCHISPVKGKNTTGLFHCQNLFYGGSYQNRKFGIKYISGGLSISNRKLLEKWEVTKVMSNNDILIKIEKYLKDVITKYIEIYPVRKSKKLPIIRKILGIDQSSNFDDLMSASYKSLSGRWAELSAARSSAVNLTAESKYLAYMDSLTRFINYGGGRTPILKKLRRTMVIGYMALERIEQSKTYNKYFYVKYEPLIIRKYGQAMLSNPDNWPKFKDLLYNTAFEPLQGASPNIKQFRKLVMSYLIFPEKAWKVKETL